MCGRVIAYFHRIVPNVTFAETYPRHLETFGYCACSKEEKAECHERLPSLAFTSVVMKCFENIVLKQLIGHTEESLDGYQFAYRQRRSSEDAVLILLHCVHSHLDVLNTYTRILYIDFSSAFNTLQSHVMVQRLLDQSIPRDLCSWILDFLSNRKQYVRVGDSCSSTITVNTGAPQGCVLSPVLFILYTNNLRSTQPVCYIIKYADDTAVIGNISNGNEDP